MPVVPDMSALDAVAVIAEQLDVVSFGDMPLRAGLAGGRVRPAAFASERFMERG